MAAAAAAKWLQSCPTLCDPIDGSPPGSRVPGILQARILEWVAISLSNAWRWKVKVKSLSPVRLWATPWTSAHQAPPSMGFSRQEYWSGVPLPSPLFELVLNKSKFRKLGGNKCLVMRTKHGEYNGAFIPSCSWRTHSYYIFKWSVEKGQTDVPRRTQTDITGRKFH